MHVFTFGTLQRPHLQQSGSLTLADGTDRLPQKVGNNLPKFTGVKNTRGGQNIEEYAKYWHPGIKENCSSNTGKTQRLQQKKKHTHTHTTEYKTVKPDQQK